MKKNLTFGVSILLMVLLFQSFYSGPETEAKLSQLLTRANMINLQYPQEKVYLHVDRPSYWANDDIWFKAYLKNSPIPTCNLYVELLNAKGAVLQKKICWAQNGLSYGDFHLPDTISTGVYQIRAYTNWMRNFDESGFYRKNIIVWNLRDKKGALETADLKERKVDFQFFPEGGTFINGINNRVAFKVTDQNEKGLDVEGRVIDELGNEVTTFKSGFKGIGSFTMMPLPGKRYRAVVMVANQFSMEVSMPVAQEVGVALAVEKYESNLLHVKVAEKTTNSSASTYYLVGRAAGEVFYKKEVQLTDGNFTLDLQKNSLPAGILQFTLFDSDLIPRCERLVFANMPEVIDISVKPEEEEYSLRGMTILDLEAFDKDDNPCRTNLSVSAYHPDMQLKWEEYPHTIISQFLLGSELKGVVEEPGWYFKDQNAATITALDNLMLTHGWRHFEWKEMKEDKMLSMDYPAEESIQLRGTVKNFYTKKPISNGTVTMMTVKSLLSVKDQKTDSLGRFIFPDLYFNDTIEVTLQAENTKGRKNTVIELDKRSSVSPAANYLPVAYQYKQENQTTTTDYLSSINPQVINRKWRLSDTILLSEVSVQGYKQKKDDGLVRMYGEADFVYDMAKQDNVYSNVYDAIDGKLPGVTFDKSTNSFMARNQPLLIYLDGIRVDDPTLLSTFSSNLFDKIEYVKMGMSAGINYPGGILYFYQKRGKKFENVNNVSMGLKGDEIIGYSVIRQFYSPKYNPDEVPETRNDFRNTLYWNPVVQTDSTGIATIGYFNSDQAGEVQVVVEGVTLDGKLCRGVGKYSVKE
jgi:hypothetical protein